MQLTLETFVAKWSASGAAERANKDSFLNELCDVLGVPRPNPTTGDSARDTYVFEKDVPTRHEGGAVTTRKIDLYKAKCFILEAKQGSAPGAKKVGTAKRDTPAWALELDKAKGQALQYAQEFDDPVPFLVVCDIGYCFDIYASFDGSTNYQPFPNAQARRLFLADLAKHADTLRAIWQAPLSLDPSRRSAKITREVAIHLAELAKKLDAAGHDQEAVATFLMRCLFTMFAEDVGLLPEAVFKTALRDHWIPTPTSFPGGVESLWRAMNEGGHVFGVVGKLLQFNGGLFANPVALPLDREGLELLLEASKCDWSEVEPAIFGTLLERALDPKERHRLGAHYTPRAYVERLVRPTIEEPLRAEWDVVRAQVVRLIEQSQVATTAKIAKARNKDAIDAVKAFHRKLAGTRVLDPACGTGNFLYVTLDLFKRLESEILEQQKQLGETQTLLAMESIRVTPAQFLGIEVKRWAKEIAELVLWIGYLQWHFRMYSKSLPVPEPVLQDYKNIECRDAVLAYDAVEVERDADGNPVTRWDGETTKTSPVTGEQIPDEAAQVPVYRYVNPRKAEWPQADFVVGNPPFVGTRRMRLILGDGYVDALTSAAPDVPENADYVMYWWDHSAEVVRDSKARRFGLITTNSIAQTFNRAVVQRHLEAERPLSVAFAIPDHPWVDSADGAAVRVALTVGVAGKFAGSLLRVKSEMPVESGENAVTLTPDERGFISQDLRVGASPAGSSALRANSMVAYWGVKFYGDGFIVTKGEAKKLEEADQATRARPFISGRDLTGSPRRLFAIDCDGLDEPALRERYPAAYQRLLERVKPVREHNPRAFKRERWWIFGENQPGMRNAVRDLERYLVTTETAKHRVFQIAAKETLSEGTVTVVALEDAMSLGVLSSRVHVVWALAAGGRLGVGNDPRYNKTRCFDPFPFPVCTDAQAQRIRDLGEALDAHRKTRQAEHADLTITGMYNVLEKLRAEEPLSVKERAIHEKGLVSVLKQIHDDLDAAVFDAYGWPDDLTDEQILEKLVALNAERADEERRGIVRWLRPEFQNPTGKTASAPATASATATASAPATAPATAPVPVWPKKLPEQIAAVRDLVLRRGRSWTSAEVAASFKAAKAKDVEPVLDSLAALGLLVAIGEGADRRWHVPRRT